MAGRRLCAVGDGITQALKLSHFTEDGLIGEFYVLDRDAWQVEVMNNLDQVPAVGAYLQVSFPNFAGAPGFPVRAIAYLPDDER